MDVFVLLEEAGRVEPPEDTVVEAAVSVVLRAARPELRDQEAVKKHNALPRGRRRMVRTIAVGVALAAAITIVSIVATGFGPGRKVAFAGWSATPTVPSPGQVAAADRVCIANANRVSRLHFTIKTGTHPTTTLATPFGSPEGSWTPVVEDTRGPYTLVVMTLASTIGRQEAACLTGPGKLAEHPTMMTASGTATPPPQPDAVGTTGWSRGRTGGDSILLGTVGKQVTGVTLTLTDGTTVRATVQNGIYAAWWPGMANPVSAVASTATGTTTTHSLSN